MKKMTDGLPFRGSLRLRASGELVCFGSNVSYFRSPAEPHVLRLYHKAKLTNQLDHFLLRKNSRRHLLSSPLEVDLKYWFELPISFGSSSPCSTTRKIPEEKKYRVLEKKEQHCNI
jgi:hypothetical protein